MTLDKLILGIENLFFQIGLLYHFQYLINLETHFEQRSAELIVNCLSVFLSQMLSENCFGNKKEYSFFNFGITLGG